MRFKIKTPNPKYTGVTYGVYFHEGYGYTDSERVLRELVKNFGYEDVSETEPGKVRCKAVTKNGTPCKKYAEGDSEYCNSHANYQESKGE